MNVEYTNYVGPGYHRTPWQYPIGIGNSYAMPYHAWDPIHHQYVPQAIGQYGYTPQPITPIGGYGYGYAPYTSVNQNTPWTNGWIPSSVPQAIGQYGYVPYTNVNQYTPWTNGWIQNGIPQTIGSIGNWTHPSCIGANQITPWTNGWIQNGIPQTIGTGGTWTYPSYVGMNQGTPWTNWWISNNIPQSIGNYGYVTPTGINPNVVTNTGIPTCGTETIR